MRRVSFQIHNTSFLWFNKDNLEIYVQFFLISTFLYNMSRNKVLMHSFSDVRIVASDLYSKDEMVHIATNHNKIWHGMNYLHSDK